MKSFTKNGYKNISLMCFGDAAKFVSEYMCGTIWTLVNPRLMKQSKSEYGITYCIESESQL